MREHGLTRRRRPRIGEAGHGHGDGVVHDRLGLVDDRGREVLEAERGHKRAELHGQRRLGHGFRDA